MRQFFRLPVLSVVSLVVTIVLSWMVYTPAPVPAQGVCPPPTKTLQGTRLTVSSDPIGFTFVRFVRHDNVIIDGLMEGSENAYAWPIEDRPTSVTFKVTLKDPTQPGHLYFAMWRAGCAEPDLLWEDIKPTKWGWWLAREKGTPAAPVQLPKTSGCRNAEVRQDITYDGDKNTHTIRLSGTMTGNSIVAIHGTDVWGDHVTIEGVTYDKAPFTHQLSKPTVGLDLVIASPPGRLPFVGLTVETQCGRWFGGVQYVDLPPSPNP